MKQEFPTLDTLFSFFVFITIVILAAYMAVRISTQGIMFMQHVQSGLYFDQEFMDVHSRRALHSIAEVIILIKAYRILVSYLNTHHVAIKYIVEISIIAPAIELVFASDMHSMATNITFAIFGLANLVLYLMYYGPAGKKVTISSKR